MIDEKHFAFCDRNKKSNTLKDEKVKLMMTNMVNNNQIALTEKRISQEKNAAIPIIVTAGSTYLDIDAYACCVAMNELLKLKGENSIAYSGAPCNYSVCDSLVVKGQIEKTLPPKYNLKASKFVVVDVSDPNYLSEAIPLNQIIEIYDHHYGFEGYWHLRLGDNSHIENVGAAATLIYRKWKEYGMESKITHSTALLLIAAILDNTLNLTSSITTQEDIVAFDELCQKENVGKDWRSAYFTEVQMNVERDLKNALLNDIKNVSNQSILPSKIAQVCVWDTQSILNRKQEICYWFRNAFDDWMINIVDIKNQNSYFLCDDSIYQQTIEKIFGVCFKLGVAKCKTSWLRKEIIKRAYLV